MATRKNTAKPRARDTQQQVTTIVQSAAESAFRSTFDQALRAAAKVANPPNIDVFVVLYVKAMQRQVTEHADQWGIQL